MDADDTIEGNFSLDLLNREKADSYNLIMGSKNFTYYRPLIIKNDPNLEFSFRGAIHEYLYSPKNIKKTQKYFLPEFYI